MFEYVKSHKVIVSGPQRSGTRICSEMVATDTGLTRIDEVKLPALFKRGEELDCVKKLIDERDNFVLHAPTFARWVHEVDATIIFMRRDLKEIQRSQDRIFWKKHRQDIEIGKYGLWRWKKPSSPGLKRTFKSVAEVKYEFWDTVQRDLTRDYVEVPYDTLQYHELWVPAKDRVGFKWNQTRQ